MRGLLVFFGIFIFASLSAQDSLDWDIDSIFDEPGSPSEDTNPDTADTTVLQSIRQRGLSFDVYSALIVGYSAGWYESPWSSGKEGSYQEFVLKMHGSFGIDAKISEAFRAKSNIYYEVPNFSFKLGDFFFDYNFYNAVFFRGGKYNLSWAISPYSDFTSLLSRVPKDSFYGESFIFKADVPIDIGGIQALAMTRADLLNGVIPKIDDFGFGGKYNLALRWADFNFGVFYQDHLPLRGFLSIKATILGVELYNEWLGAINVRAPAETTGAVNLGFANDFFSGKLRVAGEVSYNAEKDAYWYRPETILGEAEISPSIEGINGTLNLGLRLGDKGNPRLFFQAAFAPLENSFRVIPGFSLNPWSNIELYFAVPMALGNKDGYYYVNTVNKDGKRPLPFSIALLLNLNGSVRFSHYY